MTEPQNTDPQEETAVNTPAELPDQEQPEKHVHTLPDTEQNTEQNTGPAEPEPDTDEGAEVAQGAVKPDDEQPGKHRRRDDK